MLRYCWSKYASHFRRMHLLRGRSRSWKYITLPSSAGEVEWDMWSRSCKQVPRESRAQPDAGAQNSTSVWKGIHKSGGIYTSVLAFLATLIFRQKEYVTRRHIMAKYTWGKQNPNCLHEHLQHIPVIFCYYYVIHSLKVNHIYVPYQETPKIDHDTWTWSMHLALPSTWTH